MADIDQLRADLEVLDKIRARYDKDADFTTLVNNMRDRLEAEADPWREAKMRLVEFKLFTDDVGEFRPVKDYVDHLNAEIAMKDERIAELDKNVKMARKKCNELYESKRNAESQRDRAWKRIAALEDAKPIATVAKIIVDDPTLSDDLAGELLRITGAGGAKPYEVCDE